MAQYVDLSGPYLDRLHAVLVTRIVEAGAEIIRDEIVAVINESSPTGRRYAIPGTQPPRRRDGQWLPGKSYRASAPGEPPAEREGLYRASWKSTPAVVEGNTVRAGVFNDRRVGRDDIPLWLILEFGTTPIVGGDLVIQSLQPRPHIRPAVERARPKLRQMVQRIAA